jgi:hypothetical protein
VSALLLSALLAAAPAAAAPPNLVNARVTVADTRLGFAQTVRRLTSAPGDPAWIAYAVPMFGEHQMCCWSSTGDIGRGWPGCRLESSRGAYTMGKTGTVALEGDRRFVVLVRVAAGRPDRIRSLSWSCGIDAGGRTVHWLEDVAPADSLDFLASLVGERLTSEKKGRSDENGALAAIAFHDDPQADALLDRFAAPGQEQETREQAVFWMGVARGRAGFERLARIARGDADPEVRDKAVFALSQNDTPEAVDVMLEVARRDASSEVRGQAVFWLGQKAGRKAVEGIQDAMANDPETEVREKAVFALSQLPADEGVPLLIKVARTHRDPEVRKKAIFWLGQSEDTRALAFFEQILK